MRRYLMFAFAVVCYGMFLATILYTIGFTSNLFVPRTIDSGATGPLMGSILSNIALLGLFAARHTVMARPRFKHAWTKVVPESIERSAFVLATCCCFGLLFRLWTPIPIAVWQITSTWCQAVLLGISFSGYALVVYSSFVIDHFELFGVK